MTRRLVLAFLVLAAAPLLSQAVPRVRVPVVVETLGNGLRLIVHEDHSVPVVTTYVGFQVGSADERPGRSGFAHLFEHLMYMGSQHAPYPQFSHLLEAAGSSNNGWTGSDQTSYFESGPNSALPLMLWLEADRMGWLLPTMDSAKLDLQRDVVRNERRQQIENQPYGLAREVLASMLYPPGHPYSWTVTGSMKDLSAASLGDVKEFYHQYYAPNNAVIVVAGDVKANEVRALVRRYFADIPRRATPSRPSGQPFALRRDTAAVLEDQVQLPRLYYQWHSARLGTADDAALELTAHILTGPKYVLTGNSGSLHDKLINQLKLATNAGALQAGNRLDGDFTIHTTARPGHPLTELQDALDSELRTLAEDGPSDRQLEQAKNRIEAQFLTALESSARKAELLTGYYYLTGNPDGFQADLDRYRAVTAEDIRRVIGHYLLAPKVILSIVPRGKPELAARVRGATP